MQPQELEGEQARKELDGLRGFRVVLPPLHEFDVLTPYLDFEGDCEGNIKNQISSKSETACISIVVCSIHQCKSCLRKVGEVLDWAPKHYDICDK